MPGKEKRKEQKVKEIGDFTVIEDVNQPTKNKITRTLPSWLAEPQFMSSELQDKEEWRVECNSHLDIKLINQLKQMNVSFLFPVQRHVIKAVMKDAHGLELVFPPKDICVAAPTGSGKTLAYVLPILQVLKNQPSILLKTIVVLPVAELAKQVANIFKQFMKPLGMYVGEAYGAKTFEEEQASLVRQTAVGTIPLNHIIVGTPGRIAMHAAQTKGFDLSHLRFLVLDEADHLLVGDWADTIHNLLQYIRDHKKTAAPYSNGPCQKLLFSATLMSNPEQLHVLDLHQPILLVSRSAKLTSQPELRNVGNSVERPKNLEEEYVVIDSVDLKVMALYDVLHKEKKKNDSLKAIVFANSKEIVRKLSVILASMAQKSFVVKEFSSAIPNRKAVSKSFRSGKIDVIVATDAMARGMDINNINVIISYEVTNVTTYTHRVGRTARAGKKGKAISLVTKDELKAFKIILGKGINIAKKIELSAAELTGHEVKFKNALSNMAKQLQKDKKTGHAIAYKTVKRNYSNLRKSLKALSD